jgi:hypothetical protein
MEGTLGNGTLTLIVDSRSYGTLGYSTAVHVLVQLYRPKNVRHGPQLAAGC